MFGIIAGLLVGAHAAHSEDAILVQFHEIEKHTSTSVLSLDSVSQMVSKLEANPGSWSESEKKMVDDLLASLKDDFEEFLKTEHNGGLARWKAARTKHVQCGTWKADRLKMGDVSTAHTKLNTARATHKLCRQSEFIWDQYVVAKGVTSTAKLHKVTAQDEALCGLMDQVKAKANSYGASNVDNKETCQVDQTELEAAACSWYQAKMGACQAQDTCVAAVDLAGTRDALLTEAENRQNLMKTIGKLKCRLTHLLETFKIGSPSNFTSKDQCDDQKTSVDALVMKADGEETLVVPTDGNNTACSSEAALEIVPGDSGSQECNSWLGQEYGDWTDAVKPKSCLQKCDAPATKASVQHGCEDSDAAKCFFYNHHFDLCGKFDAQDGFKAADACCACGKKAKDVCTATIAVDDIVSGVWINGVQITPTPNNWQPFTFGCDEQTVLAFSAHDAQDGCSTGGLTARTVFQSDNPESSWNMVDKSKFKGFAATSSSSENPAGWQQSSFDDSAWDLVSSTGCRNAQGQYADYKPCVCVEGSKYWLFRWNAEWAKTSTQTTVSTKECSNADVILLAGAKWEVWRKWDCGGNLWETGAFGTTESLTSLARRCAQDTRCTSFGAGTNAGRLSEVAVLKSGLWKSNVLGKTCGAARIDFDFFTKVPSNTQVTCTDVTK